MELESEYKTVISWATIDKKTPKKMISVDDFCPKIDCLLNQKLYLDITMGFLIIKTP